MIREALTIVLSLFALLPLVYYGFASVAARRFFRQSARNPTVPGADFTPPISILKPVRGLDRHSLEHFTSFCRQDYPSYEILFAVADASDPAIPVIRQLADCYPDRSIRLIVGV